MSTENATRFYARMAEDDKLRDEFVSAVNQEKDAADAAAAVQKLGEKLGLSFSAEEAMATCANLLQAAMQGDALSDADLEAVSAGTSLQERLQALRNSLNKGNDNHPFLNLNFQNNDQKNNQSLTALSSALKALNDAKQGIIKKS
ncbi:MAG: Nif11-like leader peptide family natural product precursor [Gammaproteobacteria bacterium]|nr:Nif11-like leader peptide family natural product precursor [Gammaproteobacteria bacterium]